MKAEKKDAPKVKVVKKTDEPKTEPKTEPKKAVTKKTAEVSVTDVAPAPEPVMEAVPAPQAKYFDMGDSVGRLNADGTFTKLTLVGGVQTTEDMAMPDGLAEITKTEAYQRVF